MITFNKGDQMMFNLNLKLIPGDNTWMAVAKLDCNAIEVVLSAIGYNSGWTKR